MFGKTIQPFMYLNFLYFPGHLTMAELFWIFFQLCQAKDNIVSAQKVIKRPFRIFWNMPVDYSFNAEFFIRGFLSKGTKILTA